MNAAPAPQQSRAPIGIAFFGDSTGVGYSYAPCGQEYGGTPCGSSYIVSQPAPDVMQTALMQMSLNVNVINNSISGAALEDLMSANPVYWGRPWAQLLANAQGAQIVVTNLALNDANRTDETLQQYAANLSAWVDEVRASGRIPVIEEPNPTCGPPPLLDQFVEQIDSVARQKQVLLIQQYKYIQTLPNWQKLLSDCVHPLPDLYEIKGQRAAQVLAPLVRSLTR